ncbi:hypothetical protein [uncultured Desulfuromusa sp.]|uniref:hypothetical protein n=1 Tax=uncultured Desulfuromusa sp. TaxID=219183 RepID=UPI002AA62A86|nr:hypothetical protein [uncultured Desulfuromusa sp.]
MKFNLISRFMTLLVCFLFVNCAHALDFNEKKTVRYSGVSFLGDYSSLTKSYPVAFDLNKRTVERQSGQLDKTLDEHIIKNPPEYLELKKELGVLNSDSHLAVTFAIEK